MDSILKHGLKLDSLKSPFFIIIYTTSMCSICGCKAWNKYIKGMLLIEGWVCID